MPEFIMIDYGRLRKLEPINTAGVEAGMLLRIAERGIKRIPLGRLKHPTSVPPYCQNGNLALALAISILLIACGSSSSEKSPERKEQEELVALGTDVAAIMDDNNGECPTMGKKLDLWKAENGSRYSELVSKHPKLPSDLWSSYNRLLGGALRRTSQNCASAESMFEQDPRVPAFLSWLQEVSS